MRIAVGMENAWTDKILTAVTHTQMKNFSVYVLQHSTAELCHC